MLGHRTFDGIKNTVRIFAKNACIHLIATPRERPLNSVQLRS